MGRDVPLSVIASWPKPNLVNPETRGWASLIINVVLLSIVIPVVGIRLYARHFMRRWLGWDDFWCVVALFFNIVFTVSVMVEQYVFNCDRHVWDIPYDTLEHLFQLAMVEKLLFTITGTAVRQSLLCFYLRLLGDAGIQWFKWVIHGTTVFNITIGLIFGFLSIFQCSPISAYWKPFSSIYGHCVNEGALTLASGVIIAFCDFLVVLLPIPIILKLHMTWRAKVGVICLLNLGMAASGVAVVRTYYIWKALVQSYDTSWWAYPLYIAAAVEINVALICSCAPACRPWFAEYMPWVTTPVRWLGRLRSIYTYSRGTSRNRKQSTMPASEEDGSHGSDEKNSTRKHATCDSREVPLIGGQDLEMGTVTKNGELDTVIMYADKGVRPTRWYDTEVQDDPEEDVMVLKDLPKRSHSTKKNKRPSSSPRNRPAKFSDDSNDVTLVSLTTSYGSSDGGYDTKAMLEEFAAMKVPSRSSSVARPAEQAQRATLSDRGQRSAPIQSAEDEVSIRPVKQQDKAGSATTPFRRGSIIESRGRSTSPPRGRPASHSIDRDQVHRKNEEISQSTAVSCYHPRQTHAGIGSINRPGHSRSTSENEVHQQRRSDDFYDPERGRLQWEEKRRESYGPAKPRPSFPRKNQSFPRTEDLEADADVVDQKTSSFDKAVARLPTGRPTAVPEASSEPPSRRTSQGSSSKRLPSPPQPRLSLSQRPSSQGSGIALPVSRFQKKALPTPPNQPGRFAEAARHTSRSAVSRPRDGDEL